MNSNAVLQRYVASDDRTDAVTRAGLTSMAANAPVEVQEHEAVHRQQYTNWLTGAPEAPVGQLEEEARRRPARPRLGAGPDVVLGYEPSDDVPLGTYIVLSGDTLSRLAKQGTGDASRYGEMMRLNGLSSPDLEVGDALLVPPDWNHRAMGIHEPVSRPHQSLEGQAEILRAMSFSDGIEEVQRKIDDVAEVLASDEGSLSNEQLQFLSEFLGVLQLGSIGRPSEPRQAFLHYFVAAETGGDDFPIRPPFSFFGYTQMYANSKVVQRARVLMIDLVRQRVATGHSEGLLTSADIPVGDPVRWPQSMQDTLGQIRGHDWRGRDTLDRTRAGHLMIEQQNTRVKYTDNNFVLRVQWRVADENASPSPIELTWSVRDPYMFRSAAELRDLGHRPEDLATDLPAKFGGGVLKVPDHLLHSPEQLGWARRYHLYVEWTETVKVTE